MDRRVIWAIALMMVIAIVPGLFLRRPAPGAESVADSARAIDSPLDTGRAAVPGAGGGRDAHPTQQERAADGGRDARPTQLPAARADTIMVTSDLYTYGISTRGAEVVSATLKSYGSMAPGSQGEPVQLLADRGELLGLTLVAGGDTVRFSDWQFTASAESLNVTSPTTLQLRAAGENHSIDLTYTFTPDDYQIGVSGRIDGVGPNGGSLLIGLGSDLLNTEADSNDNHYSLAIVTKHDDTERTDLSSLEPAEPRVLNGPFEWAAVKSKYFVTAVLDFDSAGGGLSSVRAVAPASAGDDPTVAEVRAIAPIAPSGAFSHTLYAGPLEYPRLSRIGHDFDDVNPYGWPGFRTLIRPAAVGARWLLVWMHDNLSLAYGSVLILFGILVRLLLWPLNQKAMRASLRMQAVQPLMKEIQDRHKDNPEKMQQEVFKLYREHKVNPFGGCWPMLLPMPVLLALFFVFQNTIELRGASYLWLPDLSRPDPLYIIPFIMGLSMYGLSKVGMMGMEPNPQMKMMLYIMPVMMTVLFLNFASGLNLYYAVSNIATIPQQWLLARERMRQNPPKTAAPPPIPPMEAKAKPAPPARKRKRA